MGKLKTLLAKFSLQSWKFYGAALLVVTLAPVVVIPLISQKTVYVGKIVTDIRFQGLKNTDPLDLVPLLSMQRGLPLQKESMNADLKRLFETGYFSNMEVRYELVGKTGVKVYFLVEEHARISEIDFRGVDELYPADLKKVLSFSEGDVFSLQKVKESSQTLRAKYSEEGFFLAEVWFRIGRLDKKSNQLKITFIVDEGENIPVAKINIIGTRFLDPEGLIAGLEHKEEGLIEDGIFRETTFEEDKFKLLAYAKTRGFLDAEIDPSGTGYEIRWKSPNDPTQGRVVVITYKIQEGNIRYFGGYSMEHDPRFINRELNPPERKIKTPKDLRPVYKTKDIMRFMEFNDDLLGTVFDEGKYFRDRGQIQDFYSRQGYVYASAQPRFITVKLTEENLKKYEACGKVANPIGSLERKCKSESQWLNIKGLRTALKENPESRGRVLRHIHFVIRENGLAYIENIIIKGMVKTQERVIRRELLVKEGQLFNSALVKRSREKISNLGYFKEVNLKSAPGSDQSKMNLIIDVKEQPTGTISMGGGYGTASGFSIFTEVGENNLNGTGQKVKGKLEYGPLQRSLSISWTDPWIYETCQDNTGNFWKNKQKQFDEARDLGKIEEISDSFQNDFAGIGRIIRGYVKEVGDSPKIEDLDRVKVKIRRLLAGFVGKEEACYRNPPRPWSFTASAFWSNRLVTNGTIIAISRDSADTATETSTYEKTSLGFLTGVSHTFLVNWAHYHSYSPSWSKSSRPTALVSNAILNEVELGWQFKSSLRNGIVYDTRDNVFNTTRGLSMDLSLELVGQALGGQDHYNRYTLKGKYYWWWFDYTLGGLIRKYGLRRWRVVQEFRFSGTFTHETAPFRRNQNKETNPYIEPDQRLFLGGYETLRGYDYLNDPSFPVSWWQFGGGSHMLLFSSEIRFPIEPSILWFVLFFDSGAIYNNIGEFTGDNPGDNKYAVDTYEQTINANKAVSNPVLLYLQERFNLTNYNPYPYAPLTDWNNPKRTVLSQRNVALDRALYSWGFGVRIQIPVLPLRLFMAKKMYYAGGGKFKPIPGDDKFEFVFGIGDIRF